MLMFSRRLRSIRIACGFADPNSFAEAINVTPERYAKFEAGKMMPHPDELETISRLTQKSLGWLITGKGAAALAIALAVSVYAATAQQLHCHRKATDDEEARPGTGILATMPMRPPPHLRVFWRG